MKMKDKRKKIKYMSALSLFTPVSSYTPYWQGTISLHVVPDPCIRRVPIPRLCCCNSALLREQESTISYTRKVCLILEAVYC